MVSGSTIFQILLLLCLCLSLASSTTQAASSSTKVRPTKNRHYYEFNVEYMFGSPDCFNEDRLVMGINGRFPGPTIRATAGDTLHIKVINKLHTEGVTIHWHGIRQIGTPWADGTASISQCPINPGESFDYRFVVDKPGTYFYHSHYGTQRTAGLYGVLIVDPKVGENEPFKYDGEFTLLFSDWWHKNVIEQEVGLSSVPFRGTGEPQSLLINGRGQFHCSLAARFENTTRPQCNLTAIQKCSPVVLQVQPNKNYRIRLVSTTSLGHLNMQIGGHTMQVVEADGNYVEPFSTTQVDIYTGETYSVLIKTNQDPSQSYWIALNNRVQRPGTPTAYAILRYTKSTSPLPTSRPPPVLPFNITDRVALAQKVRALPGSPQPPTTYDKRIYILNSEGLVNGAVKWHLNNMSLVLPPTPYLGAIKYDIKEAFDQRPAPEDFDRSYDIENPPKYNQTNLGNRVYRLGYNITVDIILQNANAMAPGNSPIHPWHLHGHDFWVLGYGLGKFNESVKFNLTNAPLKQTAPLFSRGWLALRFVTDNPGAWAFHCHLEPHLHQGMGAVFAEAMERVGKVPVQALTCGFTARKLMEKNVK